jgi:DNA-binding response OmpR family regulator
MAQTPVASRFDFTSREPYLAPPPRLRPRVVTISALLFAPDDAAPPPALTEWLARHADQVLRVRDSDELMAISLRGRPRVVAFDARLDPKPVELACARLKRDSFTGVVPAVILTKDSNAAFAAAFESGADEVLREGVGEPELVTRLDAMLRRSDRDLVVHPSTRLPGAVEIEAEVTRRLETGARFAMCYADLDHFK